MTILADGDQRHPGVWVGLGKLLAWRFVFMHTTSLQLVCLKGGKLLFKTIISPELF